MVKLIQRIPRDFLAIYSDNYVTQTKQKCLSKLIGKPPLELSGQQVASEEILHGTWDSLRLKLITL